MEALESVSWNSGGKDWLWRDFGVCTSAWVEFGGVGETTISRHWGVLAVDDLEAEGLSG